LLFETKYRKSTVESENGCRATVGIADTWIKRLHGFKKKGLSRSVEGVVIHPCSSIHTIGMKFDIDVYFLDQKLRVLRVYPSVGPYRCKSVPGARYVLEFKSGEVVFPFANIGENVRFT